MLRSAPRPRSNPAPAGTVPLGQLRCACRRAVGPTRTLSFRSGLSLRWGEDALAAPTLRHAAATVARWSKLIAFASRNPKLRRPSGRAWSVTTPAPAFATPALRAKYPGGQETKSALAVPAGRTAARKTVRPSTTRGVADGATTRAASANA